MTFARNSGETHKWTAVMGHLCELPHTRSSRARSLLRVAGGGLPLRALTSAKEASWHVDQDTDLTGPDPGKLRASSITTSTAIGRDVCAMRPWPGVGATLFTARSPAFAVRRRAAPPRDPSIVSVDSQPRFTTLRLCDRCQIYKPKKDFVYVEGSYVCTDCSYSTTQENQPLKSAKPAREKDQ